MTPILISCFIPIDFLRAITQNQINAEVQIVCPDDYGNWFSGSGTIIDPKGIILTNKHVVTDVRGDIIKTCFVGFIESINQAPNFGGSTTPNFATVKYYTATNDMDAAILYLNNPTNKIYTFVNIWDSISASLRFGDKVEVIGFPSIGGSTITYTSGDFSGFGSQVDGTQNYIKSTAPLEHGNSGGAAYHSGGEFVGVPTMVAPGELNSLAYILSVDSIKNWLKPLIGESFSQETPEQKTDSKPPLVDISGDRTPPDINGSKIYFSRYVLWHNGEKVWSDAQTDWKPNFAGGKYNEIKISICSVTDSESGLAGYYFYSGNNLGANPITEGTYYSISELGSEGGWCEGKRTIPQAISFSKEGIYYFKIVAKDNNNNLSQPIVASYLYENTYYKQIKNIRFYKDNGYSVGLGEYTFNFTIDKSEKYLGGGLWSYPENNNNLDDSLACKTRLPNIYFEWDYSSQINPAGSAIKILNANAFNNEEELHDPTYSRDPLRETSNGTTVANNRASINNLNRGKKVSAINHIRATSVVGSGSKIVYEVYIKPFLTNGILLTNHGFITLVYEPSLNRDIVCIGDRDDSFSPPNNFNFFANQLNHNSLHALPVSANSTLTKRLNGYILLQVESSGEAWYVNPADGKRYYLKDGATAYQMMRNFGLGITNADLAKIPQENEKNKYPTLVNRLKGKILLQVESYGEAWYVDPKTGYRHYMKDGEAAYGLMRYYSLGITNNDLEKIPEGNLE